MSGNFLHMGNQTFAEEPMHSNLLSLNSLGNPRIIMSLWPNSSHFKERECSPRLPGRFEGIGSGQSDSLRNSSPASEFNRQVHVPLAISEKTVFFSRGTHGYKRASFMTLS